MGRDRGTSITSTTSVGTRSQWSNQIEFVLSCIGYAVGTGNLWRFPYLCMRNGGGAFLIPYFFFMFVCGIPLFALELSLGQYSKLSPLSVWKICPLFRGLGWGSVIVSAIVSVYFNIIMAWALYYLVKSFTSELPWASCGNSWNTHFCTTANQSSSNGTFNLTHNIAINSTAPNSVSAAEEFWQHNVLEMSNGIHNLGEMRIELIICLLVAWIGVFLCLSKGIRTSGKVVYVTAILPYIILIILFVRGLMLPGAMEGIKYFVTPQWHLLSSFNVWLEACLQIFFSLGPGWGTLITLASYNKFDNNCVRDGIVVPIVNCFTSFFAGLVIFSIIGFMAEEAGLPVKDVITSGPGLAFIAYPEAITKLPFSPAWSILFFLMILSLGLDTQFGMFETVCSGFFDEFPRVFGRFNKTVVTGAMTVLFFLLGLPFATQGGIYIFQLVDWYCASLSIMMIAFFECFIISYIYGVDRFLDDIYMMVNYKPNVILKICWKYITPFIVLAIFVISTTKFSPPFYGDYTYPDWAVSIGWCVAMLSVIPIPILAIVNLIRGNGSLLDRFKFNLRPSPDWGNAPHHLIVKERQTNQECSKHEEESKFLPESKI